MPFYKYKAMNSNGAEMEGEIIAESINQAAGLLKEQGLFPISITESKDKQIKNSERSEANIKEIPTSQYRKNTVQKGNIYIVVFCIFLCMVPMAFITENGKILFSIGFFLLAFIAIIIYIFSMFKTGKYSYMNATYELKESSFKESPTDFIFWIFCNLFIAALCLTGAILLYKTIIQG